MNNEALRISNEDLKNADSLVIKLDNGLFWGKDERGRGEHQIYDETEELIRKIKLIPDTQEDGLEIKLLPPKPHFDRQAVAESQSELDRPNPFDFKKIYEIQMQSVSKIKDLFNKLDLDFTTPINLERHFTQEDSHEQLTCVVASIRNALEALSLYSGDEKVRINLESEKTLIEKLGGVGVFEKDRMLGLDKVGPLLAKEFGLQTVPTGNIIALIHELERGGVAIVTEGAHARLISGAEIKGDDIRLRIHDPFPETHGIPKLISLETFVRTFQPHEFFNNLLLIQRQS